MHPEVEALLDELLRLYKLWPAGLVGLYLYGSLVTGDFDIEISDIDLLAVTSKPLSDDDMVAAGEIHDSIVSQFPRWEGRLDVAYVPVEAFRSFRTQASMIAVISPGEPFHRKEAGIDWLVNWYIVRSQGIPLLGPPADQIIDPISHEEFVQAVRRQAAEWDEWVEHMRSRPAQAYAILTLCRALHVARVGIQVSKLKAAEWAIHELPEWEPVIRNALLWRENYKEPVADPERAFPTTARFVRFVIGSL